MIDTRLQGHALRKASNSKAKSTHSNHQPLTQNPTQSFYSSLSSMATNGTHHPPINNRQTTKHSPMPFLPPVSGASAFSNYSTNTGHSTSILHKVRERENRFGRDMPLCSRLFRMHIKERMWLDTFRSCRTDLTRNRPCIEDRRLADVEHWTFTQSEWHFSRSLLVILYV